MSTIHTLRHNIISMSEGQTSEQVLADFSSFASSQIGPNEYKPQCIPETGVESLISRDDEAYYGDTLEREIFLPPETLDAQRFRYKNMISHLRNQLWEESIYGEEQIRQFRVEAEELRTTICVLVDQLRERQNQLLEFENSIMGPEVGIDSLSR